MSSAVACLLAQRVSSGEQWFCLMASGCVEMVAAGMMVSSRRLARISCSLRVFVCASLWPALSLAALASYCIPLPSLLESCSNAVPGLRKFGVLVYGLWVSFSAYGLGNKTQTASRSHGALAAEMCNGAWLAKVIELNDISLRTCSRVRCCSALSCTCGIGGCISTCSCFGWVTAVLLPQPVSRCRQCVPATHCSRRSCMPKRVPR